MSEFTQQDSDNLADIIWWIMGYHAASEDAYQICPFKSEHVESLKKARDILAALEIDKQKKKGKGK